MIGILVVTHGDFAKGLKNAVELIAGKQENFEAIGLYHGDSIEEFYEKVKTSVLKLGKDNGVLVFTDILGGSPSNTILKLLREESFKSIVGVNMPMICHAVLARLSNIALDKLFEECIEIGKSNQYSLNDVYDKMQKDVEEDF